MLRLHVYWHGLDGLLVLYVVGALTEVTTYRWDQITARAITRSTDALGWCHNWTQTLLTGSATRCVSNYWDFSRLWWFIGNEGFNLLQEKYFGFWIFLLMDFFPLVSKWWAMVLPAPRQSLHAANISSLISGNSWAMSSPVFINRAVASSISCASLCAFLDLPSLLPFFFGWFTKVVTWQ